MKNSAGLILHIVVLSIFAFSFAIPVQAQVAEETLKNPSPCGTVDNPVEVPFSIVLRVDPLPQATKYFWFLDATPFSVSDEASFEIAIGTNNVHWWAVKAYKGEESIGDSRACYIKGTSGIGDTTSPGDTSSPSGGTIGIKNPLKTNSLPDLLDALVNFIFRAALVVAPLMIIYGGFLFVTGGGNPEQISRGKRVLMWTVIGLIVIILSKGLIALLQTALGVNGS